MTIARGAGDVRGPEAYCYQHAIYSLSARYLFVISTALAAVFEIIIAFEKKAFGPLPPPGGIGTYLRIVR